MSSLNKIQIIGNLGKDPETRYTGGGLAITTFSVATSERWKDKDSGEQKEHTEWHRVTAFGKLGEIAGEYLSKGRKVYVEGRLRTESWEDQDGIKRYSTKIMADQIIFLSPQDGAGDDGRGQNARGAQQYRDNGRGTGADRQPPQRGAPQPVQNTGFDEDDIPF